MPRFLWTQKQDIGPGSRANAVLAYDSLRGLTYLFGGYVIPQNARVYCADTWAWDGRFWTQVARFGPLARAGHTMNFDAARSNSVVFGGASGINETLGDTWIFDGVEWTQIEDFGPSARHQHAAAYDPARRRVVLFGGVRHDDHGLHRLNDTWEWDGESWTQVEAAGPSPRNGHAMAYDTYRNRVVLFGGLAEDHGGPSRYVNDTWEWDGDTWTQVADIGPSPRRDAAMSGNDGGVVILHGGIGDDNLADTWQWVAGSWSQVQEMGPSPREDHCLAYDAGRRRMVMFGGEAVVPAPGHRLFGDTWEAAGAPSPDPGGPGPDNLTVSPGTVSLTGGPDPVIEFDTASVVQTRNVQVFLVDAVGRRQLVGEAVVPPGVTHIAQPVRLAWVNHAVFVLGLAIPATAWLTTDLGSNMVAVQLTA